MKFSMLPVNQTLLKAVYRVTKKVEEREQVASPDLDIDIRDSKWEEELDSEEFCTLNEMWEKDRLPEASFIEMKQSLFEVPDGVVLPPNDDYQVMHQESLVDMAAYLSVNSVSASPPQALYNSLKLSDHRDIDTTCSSMYAMMELWELEIPASLTEIGEKQKLKGKKSESKPKGTKASCSKTTK